MEANRRVQILLQQQKITLFDVPQAEQQVMKEVEKEVEVELIKMSPQQQGFQSYGNYSNNQNC